MTSSGLYDNRGTSGHAPFSQRDAAIPLPTGILDARRLPDDDFMALWEAIVLDRTLKDRLLSQAVLNFTLRPRIHRSDLPLHGIILLVGEPGTGKTSLARGLAARTAESLGNFGTFMYLEVEPHALASASLGRSQKAVTELLGSTIAEYAMTQPLIVLLDEVETLAANRSKMSMEANPVDVHRATDAVLAQLDQLAAKYPQLLFLVVSLNCCDEVLSAEYHNIRASQGMKVS